MSDMKKLSEALGAQELPSLMAGTPEDLLAAFYEACARVNDVGYVLGNERTLTQLAMSMNGAQTYQKMKSGRRLGGGALFFDESVKGIKIMSSDASQFIMIRWSGDR